MKIKNLKQTCCACPSQWEAETEDGRVVYIRYRWCWLVYHTGETFDEAVKNSVIDRGNAMVYNICDGVLVDDDYHSCGLCGSMSTEEMLHFTGFEVIECQ